MSSGKINATELTAALINQKEDLVSGIRFAQEQIEGSMTIILLTEKGEIYAARERNTIGISSRDLLDKVGTGYYCATLPEVTDKLKELAQPGDVILTVGAGDVDEFQILFGISHLCQEGLGPAQAGDTALPADRVDIFNRFIGCHHILSFPAGHTPIR